MLLRALRNHCPHCAERRIWASWGKLKPRCPGCGYSFSREEGYWVGAMIVNIGAAQLLFMALLLGTMALTWPDVPWTGLLIGTAAVMVAFPIWFYPRTKTLWIWLDLRVHPYTPEERE
ncbi:MAG TPA: DUF983 domain-containing protein [Egibacteraceae bacterium]|nr:DUF983 domain-containing protein [Egibacteraceae bacterium]